MVIHASRIDTTSGMRPINLRSDLGPLADLIELVFASNMDSKGRATLREMRYLSRMGPGLNLFRRINDLAIGVSMGYVWIQDRQLVGNVSVSPADWPRSLGSTWIIANVGVHPDYQRRGIARQLMKASLRMIQQRSGKRAILQVDANNTPALNLYKSLGFEIERQWTTWQRRNAARVPAWGPPDHVFIRHRRRNEWKEELALAERIRPQAHGGLGWLRPLHPGQFRNSALDRVTDWINLRSTERLVIYDEVSLQLLAALWIESIFAGRTRLTLLVEPVLQGEYDDILLAPVLRRLERNTLMIEHPNDETATVDVLRRYNFTPHRHTVHMRWTP